MQLYMDSYFFKVLSSQIITGDCVGLILLTAESKFLSHEQVKGEIQILGKSHLIQIG